MGGSRRKGVETTMQLSSILYPCVLVAILFAAKSRGETSDWSDTPDAVCKLENNKKSMFTSKSEAGSSACVAFSTTVAVSANKTVQGHSHVQGKCDNDKGEYVVSFYANNQCSGTALDKSTFKLPMKVNQYHGHFGTAMLVSCAECRPDAEDNRGTLIGVFFGVILVYSLIVCAGMFVAHQLGCDCQCSCLRCGPCAENKPGEKVVHD